jgi:hypothetical protein
MSIQFYNYNVTGDCGNTNVGAVYFDITGQHHHLRLSVLPLPG